MVTKEQVLKVCGKNTGVYPLLNNFLFDCVLSGIVDFDLLTKSEKKSIILILDNSNNKFRYDKKLRRIVYR